METTISLSTPSLRYYSKARQWSSELELFKIETIFFHRLLNDYFVCLADAAHVERLKKAKAKFFQLEQYERHLNKLLAEFLFQLELAVENSTTKNVNELRNKHFQLDHLMVNLRHEYGARKSEIFNIVESAIADRKLITA